MNGFGWSSGVGDFGGPGNPYGLPSGAGALQAGVSRYLSIMRTGWDPALGIQYYEYSFTGGDGSNLERQTELAAIQYGQQACAGQAPSAVTSCIQQVYDALAQQGTPPMQGGNYDFSFANIQINGQSVSPNEFDCAFSRCGTFDSLDYSHGDGTFHVDTANPFFLPVGTVLHTIVDVLGGKTWWSGGIPRFP